MVGVALTDTARRLIVDAQRMGRRLGIVEAEQLTALIWLIPKKIMKQPWMN